MLLVTSAQVADGKLFVLGGGWSLTGPDPMPSAIAMKIDVGWHEADQAHHWELFLEDADGGPVMVDTPDGAQPVEVRGEFTVARPRHRARGTPIDVALAVNLGPLPLLPGNRFTWRLSIDGESDETWGLAFTTRPRPARPRLDPFERRGRHDRRTTGRSAATSRTSSPATSTSTGRARRSPSTTTISSA